MLKRPAFPQFLGISPTPGFVLLGLLVLAVTYGAVREYRGTLQTPLAARGSALNAAQQTPQHAPWVGHQAQVRPRVVRTYGKLPLSFEANNGQTDSQVKFLSRGQGYSLFLTGSEAVLSLRSQEPGVRSQNGDSKFDNRNPAGSFGLLARLPGGVPLTKSRSFAFNNNLPSAVLHPRVPNRKFQVPNAPAPNTQHLARTVLRMKLVGANSRAEVVGLDELPGKSNYFIGNDPKKWRTNVASYAKVKYQGIYPGIDLVYYGNPGQLEYDFVVAAGADPQSIAMEIGGTDKVEIDSTGDLVLRSSAGDVRLHKPEVYQPASPGVSRQLSVAENPKSQNLMAEFSNAKSKIQNSKLIDGRFVLTASNQIRFALGPYDKSRPLVIDPYMSYMAYMGGNLWEYAYGVTVGADGNAYVTGSTMSTDFPLVNPYQTLLDRVPEGIWEDVFVAKINPAGSQLLYSTYIGGQNTDEAYAIAVDDSGHAYVAGFANSTDFPTTPGSFNTTASNGDAFVLKLNPTGDSLDYSTFIWEGGANGLAVDASGNAYVSGYTYYANTFPTTAGAYDTGSADWVGMEAFLTILNPSGTGLVYSTLLGGSQDEFSVKLAIDSSGMAYLSGITTSTDFPTTTGAFQTSYAGGEHDCFVAKLNPAGNGAADLVYATYLGGTLDDKCFDIAVDSSGNAYVAGQTSSTDFPVVQGSYRTTFIGGVSDAFVTKLNSTGTALVYSTYLGGTLDGWFDPNPADESAEGIAVDSSGRAYVAGWTEAADFPVVQPVQPRSDNLCWDIFVTKLSPDGSSLEFSTTLGTYYDFDWAYDIALDSSGSMYVVGPTTSSALLVTTGNFNLLLGNDGTYHGGAYDAYVAKISPDLVPQIGVSQISATFPDQSAGTTSAPTSVVLGNYTSTPIDMTEIQVLDGDGNPSADFTVDSKDCVRTYAVGDSCSVDVTFNPVSSSGGSSLSLRSLSNAARLVDGSRARPADTSPFGALLTGTLSAKTSLPGATKISTIPLAGAMLLPAVSLAPESLSFSDQVVLTVSPPQPIVVSNGGLAPLTISGVGFSGTDSGQFTLTDACAGHTLGPLQTCSVSVAFAPTTLGDKAASLSIVSNAPASPSTIALAGKGIPAGPGDVSPLALGFEGQRVGSTSSEKQVTLLNSSGGPLTITSLNISGGNSSDFARSHNCPLTPLTLGAGSGCTINVTFTATAAKPRKSLLTIAWNASSGPRRVMLTGVGTAIGVSPTSLTFASQQPGTTSSPQTVTVHNYGSAAVAVWSSALGGASKTEFSRTNSCPVPPATLAANGSCTIAVQFSPTSAGAKSAALLISHDGGGSPGSVSLTGTASSALQTQVADSPVLIAPIIVPGTAQTTGDGDSSADGKRKTKAKAAKERTEPQ